MSAFWERFWARDWLEQADLDTDDDDPRPCHGTNSNVCVAEGCYGQACITPARYAGDSKAPATYHPEEP